MRITIHSLSAIMLAALVAGQAWGVDAGPKLEIFLPGKTVPEEPALTEVIAWGYNGYGQTTVPSSAQSGVVAIAAGYRHTVALLHNGSVLAWGDNSLGQISVPAGLGTVVAISAGWYHTVALKEDGTVVSWGQVYNDGVGFVPATVPSGLSGVTAIATGSDHTVALKQDGSVVAWGRNAYGQTNVPSGLVGVMAVAAAEFHTVALKRDGSVVAWGGNAYGQTNPPSGLSGVVAIAASSSTTMALKQDGSVVVWGNTTFGPGLLPPGLSGVVAIAGRWNNAAARKQDGSVVAWGFNFDGQTNVPDGLRDAKAVAVGVQHMVAIGKLPRQVDLGNVNTGHSLERSFALASTGLADVTGLSAQIIGPQSEQFSIVGSPLPTTLATGSTASLTVRFTPNGVGLRSTTLRITSNDPDFQPYYEVRLIATATVPEIVVESPASLADGSSVAMGLATISDSALTRSFTIRNTGTGALECLVLSKDGADASDFTVSALDRDRLAAGESQSFTVGFAPSASGPRTATLHIASNVADKSPFDIVLTARGTAIDLAFAEGGRVSRPRQDIALGILDTGSLTERSFVLRNTGAQALTGLRLEITGTEAGQFTVTPVLPSRLEAGASVSFTMRFTARLSGAIDTVLRLLSDQANEEPAQLRFTGTVRAPKLVVRDSAEPLSSGVQGNRIIAWGWNGYGQANVPSSALSGVVAIATGWNHTVALKQDCSVIAWGYNDYGQTTVPSSAQSGVVAIAVGGAHTVALKQDGSVIAWGWNGYGQRTVPSSAQSGVVAIAAGGTHTVALKQDGSVIAWGDNRWGQRTVPSNAQSGVVAIAAGGSHTVALKQDGSVLAWGDNYWGQTTVPSSAQSGVVAIAAGGEHTVALKQDGSVIAWGSYGDGQTTVPSSAQSGVVAIAAGGLHTVALKQDGSVIAWGWNYYGQRIVPSSAQSGVVAIAAGGAHTVALKFTGLLFGPSLIGQSVNFPISVASEGELPLTGLLTEITGPDADQFSLTGTLPGSIAPGASPVPLQVRFTPTRAGPMNATLRLHSNDPMTPVFELPLKGTGTFRLTATKPSVVGSSFTYGPLRLDRQTGLMLQKISFTNITGVPLHGLRLILSNVASGVQVYSSSVGPVLGTYEVIYSNPIATAEAISFDLVYFDPKRRTADAIHPTISAATLPAPEPDSQVVPGTVVPLRSARATPQGPFLEWNSVPKTTYVVEYSNDAGTTWFSAVHRLSTTTTRMFWVDRGQPETKTKPVGVPNKPGGRLYRVKKL